VSQHTPGPWATGEADGRLRVTGPDREANVVCDIAPRAGDVDADYTEEDAANAELIAAAPELLAACKAGLHSLRALGAGDIFEQMRAAIAKAEPRSSAAADETPVAPEDPAFDERQAQEFAVRNPPDLIAFARQDLSKLTVAALRKALVPFGTPYAREMQKAELIKTIRTLAQQERAQLAKAEGPSNG
jgi:hypothetical protein